MTGPVGLGVGFQPIAGGQLVRAPHGGQVARLPAHPRSPVHAVAAGVVRPADGGALEVRGVDGRVFCYTGLDPASLTVTPGAGVAAGEILGALGGPVLELRITDQEGRPLDAVDALVGLADPNELGYAAVGRGLGADPDAMDREVLHAARPPASARSSW